MNVPVTISYFKVKRSMYKCLRATMAKAAYQRKQLIKDLLRILEG